MKRGVSRRQYEDIVREDVYRFAVKPAMVIIGIYIVSVILQTFLKITWSPFPIIFTGIGGIPFLVFYYKRELGIK